MEKIVSLCKRRGFIFNRAKFTAQQQLLGYGPLGVELKQSEKLLVARNRARARRRRRYGQLDLNDRAVWKASGHEDTFTDPWLIVDLTKRDYVRSSWLRKRN
jgi:glycyl-tRNA synthetase